HFMNLTSLFAQNWPEGAEGIWEFKPGFYYMLEDRVNIRSQPNMEGSVIGRLSLHDRIEILELIRNPMRVGNVYSYWYLIRHNNLEGYIWGGYTAIETLIFDIDGNGQNDYFQYRISTTEYVFYMLNPRTDIYIYINGRKISIENIPDRWGSCTFRSQGNKVIMTLDRSRGPFISQHIYEIDRLGQITLVETIEKTME
ncbi:MAG: SH3 domain-containing protein, partial [Treponema sp.]|nr:SH3 domain-containing protein [Treponema sp.]